MEGRGRTLREDPRLETCLVVVEVPVDGKAMLPLFLPLRGRLAFPLPPLDQRGVAHAAEQVGLGLQLGGLLPQRTQRRALVDDGALRESRREMF